MLAHRHGLARVTEAIIPNARTILLLCPSQ
jgi:hypothetical protein